MGVEDVIRFPYVSMPSLQSIKMSIRHLFILGALEMKSNLQHHVESTARDFIEYGRKGTLEWKQDPTKTNQLGKLLARIPIAPRFGKMLIVGAKYNVLRFCIMIVASMSVPELFAPIKIHSTDGRNFEDSDGDDQDKDLVTSIDRDRSE
jgi:HrpA-like RNA helicase